MRVRMYSANDNQYELSGFGHTLQPNSLGLTPENSDDE